MTHYQMLETLMLAEIRNLRRYVYCLLGTRQASDAIVEQVLESVVDASSAAKVETISRLSLYREANERVNAKYLDARSHRAPAASLQSRLAALPLHKRQIITLSSVIGMPPGDVASIMNLPEPVVIRAQIDALRALETPPLSVLIIEDEALIARELSRIVSSLGLPIAGMAKNKQEALRIAGSSQPRIILADYQLRNGETGVDVVRSIREHLDAEVIYITAHPESAIATRDTEGDTVIPKPFHPRMVERALERLAH
jgi:CheY-like chemotaxis protein